ncbi:MAG: hypothetical protein WBA12_14745, partial [Catalinimonas sp.]
MFCLLGGIACVAAEEAPQESTLSALTAGDSLFEQGRYQRAYEHYTRIWREAGVYSPRMLLRMA